MRTLKKSAKCSARRRLAAEALTPFDEIMTTGTSHASSWLRGNDDRHAWWSAAPAPAAAAGETRVARRAA